MVFFKINIKSRLIWYLFWDISQFQRMQRYSALPSLLYNVQVLSRPSVQGWREAEGGEGAGGSEGKEGHLWVSERKVLEGWPKKAWRWDKRAQWSLSQSFGQTSCSCCYQLARRYKLLLPDSSHSQTYTVTLKGHIQRYICKCRRHFNFGLISSSLWWSNDTLSLNLISEHLTFDI